MKIISTAEAATRLGVSERRIRSLIAEKKLPAHRLGRDYAIEESALTDVKVYGKAGRPPKKSVTEVQGGTPAKRTALK